MPRTLYFGGGARDDARRPTSPSIVVDLDLLDPVQFVTAFTGWLGEVYSLEPDAPNTPEQILAFDHWPLVARFRRAYAGGRPPRDRGFTIEELHLQGQLLFSQPVTTLIATEFADLSTDRIARKRFIESRELVRLVAHNLSRWGTAARLSTLVYDGEVGHSIVLIGAMAGGEQIQYVDPWPGESLLSSGSMAGVAAVADTDRRGAWRIAADQLAKVIVAVHVPEMLWRFWTDDRSDSVTVDPIAHWTGRVHTEAEARLQGALPWITSDPGSRDALTYAASCLAAVFQERGLVEEALHWARQAATVGSPAAAAWAGDLISELLNATEEPRDAFITMARQTALAGQAEIAPMIDNSTGDTDWQDEQGYWHRRALLLEAHYWHRQAELAKAGQSPWALPPATAATEEAGSSAKPPESKSDVSAFEIKQFLPFPAVDELEVAHRLADSGDLEGAIAAYNRAVASGHREQGAVAAYELAALLRAKGSAQASIDCLLQATNSRHLDLLPWAANDLGLTYEEMGKSDAAVAALERAVFAHHPKASPVAATNLGNLYYRSNQPFRAVDAYMLAWNFGEPTQAARALFHSGLVYEQAGDTRGARIAYRRTLEWADSEFTEPARQRLAAIDR